MSITAAEQNRLITGNMPLVTTIAADYRGRGVDFEELLAIGREGLVLAARTYNPGLGKFGHWASLGINRSLADELKSDRQKDTADLRVKEWGEEHSERIWDWTAWGPGGNAAAIFEIWDEDFEPDPESLALMFEDIREKQARFEDAFKSLKARQIKVISLVYLRDPALSIEQAAREMRISYVAAESLLARALRKMRAVIAAMENNENISEATSGAEF